MTTTRSIRIEHNGKTYSGLLAKIKSTALTYSDHGILSAWLHCEWSGSGIGVGGYCLDQPKPREQREKGDYGRVGTAYGLDHLIRIMETVGVESWEKLAGQQVIVLFEGDSDNTWGMTSAGIAGVLNDKVFIPAEHAQAWKDAEAVTA